MRTKGRYFCLYSGHFGPCWPKVRYCPGCRSPAHSIRFSTLIPKNRMEVNQMPTINLRDFYPWCNKRVWSYTSWKYMTAFLSKLICNISKSSHNRYFNLLVDGRGQLGDFFFRRHCKRRDTQRNINILPSSFSLYLVFCSF